MSCHTSRIAILMISTPDIKNYGHLAAYINYKYCARHGYTFLTERCPRKQDMNKDWMWNDNEPYRIVWSKPALIRRHLPNYDYLFFIDSDAIFINHEKTVETLIEKYMKKTKKISVLVGEDCLNKTTCWDKNNLNTGAMLFKNTPDTIKILDKWINAANNECVDWKYRHTREQMCLQILKDKYYPHTIKTIPYHEINGVDGTWINHYMDMSAEERTRFLSKHFTDFFQTECQHRENYIPEKHFEWKYSRL